VDENLIQTLIEELQESKQREKDQIKTLNDNVIKINKLLIGNGEIGLCERVRRINSSIKPLWVLVSTIGFALILAMIGTFLK
jgi:hypothetical protein